MARSVADAAVILSIIAGPDPRDNFTLAQPPVVPDYTEALNADALRGARLGVPRRFLDGLNPSVVAAFDAALDTMRGLGATIVDPADFPDFDEFVASDNETVVLNVDFKVGRRPPWLALHSWQSCGADIFCTACAGRCEPVHLGARRGAHGRDGPRGPHRVQHCARRRGARAPVLDRPVAVRPIWSLACRRPLQCHHSREHLCRFITSENTTVDQAFFDAVAADKDLGATRGIDGTLQTFELDALLLPTDVSSTPAAIAGYPIVTGASASTCPSTLT